MRRLNTPAVQWFNLSPEHQKAAWGSLRTWALSALRLTYPTKDQSRLALNARGRLARCPYLNIADTLGEAGKWVLYIPVTKTFILMSENPEQHNTRAINLWGSMANALQWAHKHPQ